MPDPSRSRRRRRNGFRGLTIFVSAYAMLMLSACHEPNPRPVVARLETTESVVATRDSACALPLNPVRRTQVAWPPDSAAAVALARRALHGETPIEFPVRVTRFERERTRLFVGLVTAVRPDIRFHCGSGQVAIDSAGMVVILSSFTAVDPPAKELR